MKFLDLALWPVAGATLALYVTMLVWTLPAIAAAAAGLPVFDMRPGGYSYEEARAFLAALSPEGRTLYLDVQLRVLDFLFPALFALTLGLAIVRLTPPGLGHWRWALALIAVPGAIYDYLENNMVRFMLFLGPDNINEEIVGWASQRTQLKSMFSTVAMLFLLVLLMLWGWNRLRVRTAA